MKKIVWTLVATLLVACAVAVSTSGDYFHLRIENHNWQRADVAAYCDSGRLIRRARSIRAGRTISREWPIPAGCFPIHFQASADGERYPFEPVYLQDGDRVLIQVENQLIFSSINLR